MADEVELKPKIKCPECPTVLSPDKITYHIESHRPFNPPGPGTSPCPKGCGRNLNKNELKEHVPLCEGLSQEPAVSAPAATLAAVPFREKTLKKEEKVAAKRECPVCHEMVAGGRGFGGHMSKHGRARKTGRKPAERAVRPSRAARKRIGRTIARSTASRAGANLPPAPALHARVNSKLSAIAQTLRQAARAKRAEADELEKMAERAEELL